MNFAINRAALAGACLALTLGLGQGASAAVLFDSGVPVGATQSAVASDPSHGSNGAEAAGAFSLSSDGTIRSVDFSGTYFSTGTNTKPDIFTLSVYADDGGTSLPVAAATETTRLNVVAKANVGSINGSATDVYTYSANLSLEIMLGAGSWWVSIVNDTSADLNDNWYWRWRSETSNNIARRNSGDWLSCDCGTADFTLYDTTVVPVPPALGLMALGLAALAGLGRKRSRAA